MSDREIRIDTMEQLIEVATVENLDGLIGDLRMWLSLHVGLKNQQGVLGGAVVAGKTFCWFDDGLVGLRGVRVYPAGEES